MAVDGFLGHFQVFGELPVGHAANSFHDDPGIQVRNFLPVCSGKGLGTETAFTGFACKPLDTVGGGVSSEEADLLVGPLIAGVVVMFAVGVGTEGRSP
jgi:hypothetical protein